MRKPTRFADRSGQRIPDLAFLPMPVSKPLVFVGPTKEDLSAFPADVRFIMGHALRQAQEGVKHPDAKPLKGYKGAGVLEIIDDFDGNTY